MVNNRPLGDMVQSFSVADDKGFIVVNNSQKVEVVLLNTFKSSGCIRGILSPVFYPCKQYQGLPY